MSCFSFYFILNSILQVIISSLLILHALTVNISVAAETDYILRDEATEGELGFSLADSLERIANPSHSKLFAGMKFYMFDVVDGWKDIIETAGGTVSCA